MLACEQAVPLYGVCVCVVVGRWSTYVWMTREMAITAQLVTCSGLTNYALIYLSHCVQDDFRGGHNLLSTFSIERN